MDRTQELLLQRLSRALFGIPDNSPISDDVLSEAKEQTVSALVTKDYQTIAQNIRVTEAHVELTRLLGDIPFTTFKGYASAYYYPMPEKRTMGDVDFIVSPEYYRIAVDQMLRSGWKKVEETQDRHETFRIRNVIFELHSEIKGIPNGIDGIRSKSLTAEAEVRNMLEDLIDTSITVETQHGPIRIPDEFHHGLIMLLHVAGHMLNNNGIGLRHLCDWAVYVHRVDLVQYRDKLEKIGLWTFACQLTAVSSAFLGLPKKPWAGEWPELFLESFLNEFLSSGNFGRKNSGRKAVLILAESSYIEYVKTIIPISREYPVFLPFAMVIAPFFYIYRIISGKSKLVKLSTVTEARKRIALYDQFQLFQAGNQRE